jgi:hypothetical protein
MFRVTFICLLLLFFYSALFYSSANTPLAEASVSEWLDVLSVSLMCAAAVALAVQLVFWVLAKVCGPIAAAAPVLERVIALTIMFCLALLILENWFYSLFSLGLKSGESTLSKLLFLSGALFLAIQSVSGILFLARALKPSVYGPVIAVVSIFWVAGGLSALMQGTGSPATQLTSHTDDPINILLIASDGLNADALSVYGNSSRTTPFLDSVASEFMIFDNAYSNGGTTTGSVTAMLTGQSPLVTRVVYPPDILEDEFSSQSLPALLSRDQYLRVQWSVPHFASANEQNLIGAFDSINGEVMSRFDVMSFKTGLSSIQIWFLSG